jgi:hypothetical protein
MRTPSEKTPTKKAAVFVENCGTAQAAGAKWKKDVEAGKSVDYFTKDSYLGSTASGVELDAWLSDPSKAS